MAKDKFYAFMQPQTYSVLSTIGPAGTPQAALVGIAVTADLEIVFDNPITNAAAGFAMRF